MAEPISAEIISAFNKRLQDHPIYAAVRSMEALQCFMEHHVYSVWDFMSLIKYLQNRIAPTRYPWIPSNEGDVTRFINELVLEEESDETPSKGEFSSHFELYTGAMREIGASTGTVLEFTRAAAEKGIGFALENMPAPEPSKQFTALTFRFIESDQPHQVAAALALGREHIIPGMFRSILQRIGVTDQQAPVFHFYLNRHIHLDEDFHAPLSLKLLNNLCQDNQQLIDEAVSAAEQAVQARLQFWDGVLAAIESGQR